MPETVKLIELSTETKNGLEYINVPRDMTHVSGYSDCSELESIAIPSGATEIGASAFSGCRSLTSIAIPDSVTEIGMEAFMCCTSLTGITIPDGVTEIGSSAFKNCILLFKTVAIPDSVTKIGDDAFGGCTSITASYKDNVYNYEHIEELYAAINGN